MALQCPGRLWQQRTHWILKSAAISLFHTDCPLSYKLPYPLLTLTVKHWLWNQCQNPDGSVNVALQFTKVQHVFIFFSIKMTELPDGGSEQDPQR